MLGSCSGYLSQAFEPAALKKLVARVSRRLLGLQRRVGFDAVAFSGLSGSAVAFPVSARSGIPLIYVRKAGDRSHGGAVESIGAIVRRYVVLDDRVQDGDTVKRIVWKLKSAECVGVLLYDSAGTHKSVTVGGEEYPVFPFKRGVSQVQLPGPRGAEFFTNFRDFLIRTDSV